MYVAAVLSNPSRKVLFEQMAFIIPDKWERIGHHMTLHMGSARPKDGIGKTVKLVVDGYANNGRVLAARIAQGGEISDNERPHVTVAVNRAVGAKPFESNKLTNWISFPPGNFIVLIATIEVCE